MKVLREKAAKADELEDEISSLIRQKRAQEAKLSEVGVLKEKNVEINRLVEDNARLTEELETHKSPSLGVGGLEKENKGQAAELRQTLHWVRADGTAEGNVGGNGPKSTPVLSEPPSSVLRIDGSESGVVAKDIYQSLVRKFNKLYENHAEISSAREKIEKAFTAKKEEMNKYREYSDYLEKKVKKRDATIEQQDEELRQLRAQIQDMNDESRMSQGLKITPKMGSRQEREAQNLKEISMLLNSASSGPIHYGGRVLSFDDIIQALNSPTLNEIVAASRRIRALTNSPIRRWSLISSTPLESEHAGELVTTSGAPGRSRDERTTLYELPMLLPGGDDGSDERVIETEFEILEPYYTSTIDGYIQETSPEKAGGREIKEEPSTDTLPSPDTPIVISSKSVRKRRSCKDPTGPNEVARVKIEAISSSPIGLAAFPLDESIDLDDIGEKQITPRKGRPFLQQALRTSSSLANAVWNENHSHDHSHPTDSQGSWQVSLGTPIRRAGVSRAGSALQPRSPNTQILPRTSTERAPKRRRVASDKAVSNLIEDGQVIQSIEKSSRKRSAPTPEQAQLLGNLLAKASPPKHVLSLAQATPIQPTQGRTGSGSAVLGRAYQVPQDDTPNNANIGPPLSKGFTRSKESAEPPRPTSSGNVRKSFETSRKLSKCSLKSSVESSRPSSRRTFRDSAYESRPTSRDSPQGHQRPSKPARTLPRTPAEIPRPTSRRSLTGSEEPQRPSSKGMYKQIKPPKSAPKTTQSHSREQTTTPVGTRKQTLRSRPLNQLTLQDFRVNPSYNQGYNYAFNDVVRNQAERRCLQGCTKPECCGGKFRALAEATRDPNKPRTMSQEEADDKILKEFLGDNSYKVRNMTKDERQETLMQALARDFSNKFGKHRHAYERRQSPPGYWRSDFPDTQEQVQDRAKAMQLERDQIAHRYEEAMRGGAYIFRDE